ncbi:MAG: very short patch repair endonuclease [Terriglobia bacterium]
MPDVFTKTKRSQVMSRIRGHGNKETEVALIKLFRRQGITGWRRHMAVFGKPDFVFPILKLAVFVDGCFWHCCAKHSNLPVNNRPFWMRKLEANKQRDKLVGRTLRARGWRVLRIWQHELSPRNEKRVLQRCLRAMGILTMSTNSGSVSLD